MLINSSKAQERLESSGNLINKLRAGLNKSESRSKAMSLFTGGNTKPEQEVKFNIPVFNEPAKQEVLVPQILEASENNPNIDQLLNNADDKIKLETVARDALGCLHSAISQLKQDIPNIKSEKLADVAAKMSRVVSDIRERKDKTEDKPVHLHFYAPQRRELSDYKEVPA